MTFYTSALSRCLKHLTFLERKRKHHKTFPSYKSRGCNLKGWGGLGWKPLFSSTMWWEFNTSLLSKNGTLSQSPQSHGWPWCSPNLSRSWCSLTDQQKAHQAWTQAHFLTAQGLEKSVVPTPLVAGTVAAQHLPEQPIMWPMSSRRERHMRKKRKRR